MAQHAVVNASNVVVNIVEWDGGNRWAPPTGMRAVLIENPAVHIGWHYVNGVFSKTGG